MSDGRHCRFRDKNKNDRHAPISRPVCQLPSFAGDSFDMTSIKQ